MEEENKFQRYLPVIHKETKHEGIVMAVKEKLAALRDAQKDKKDWTEEELKELYRALEKARKERAAWLRSTKVSFDTLAIRVGPISWRDYMFSDETLS